MVAIATDEVLHIAPQEGDKLRAKALAADADELPDGYYRSVRVIATFTAISLNLMGSYLAFQGSASALSSIVADIGSSESESLFSTVWTTGQAISILLMGRITDRFGRRPFILTASVLGLIGGIVACTAKRFDTLVGAMVLLGLAGGPSGAYPLFVGELMSNKTKFLGTVVVAVPNVIASGFGPYIGQRLGHQGNWRWIFYIYLIIMVVATVLIFIWYHPPSFVQLHGKKISKREELGRVDWIGAFLLTAGMALFLLGISWGGQPSSPWQSGKILGLLISGAAALVAFVLFEIYGGAERPIVPMSLFRDLRGFTCLVLLSAVMGILNIALFIMYPQQVMKIFGSTLDDWEDVAWMSSTAAFGIWSGILILGSVFHLIKHIRWQMFVGSLWVTAFLGAMSSITRDSKNSAIAFSFLTGFVIGWAEDVTMLLVQFITNDEDLGVAFAIVSASRAVCGSIFTAAFIAVYTNKYPGELRSHLIPAVTSAGLPESSVAGLFTAIESGAIDKVPGMTDTIAKVTSDAIADSYAASYAYVYYFAMALGVVAIVASLCMQDFDQFLNNHVPHQLYDKKDAHKDLLESDSDQDRPSASTTDMSEK